MRSLSLLSLAAAVLAGCATSPPVDTSRWTPEQIARHNAAVDASSQAWASTIQQRNYVTNPVTLPAAPATGQPNFTPFGAQDDGYQNVTVMTPNGYVTRRCKKLKDGALHCL